MKILVFIIGLLFGISDCYAGGVATHGGMRLNVGTLGGGVAAASNPCMGANPSDCSLRETFDGSADCDGAGALTVETCNYNTWVVTSGTPTFNSTDNELEGTYNLYLNGTGTPQTVYLPYTQGATSYVALSAYIQQRGSGTYFFALADASDDEMCRVGITSTDGTVTITSFGGTAQTFTNKLSSTTRYYFKLKATDGAAGADSCQLWIGTNGTTWAENQTSSDGTWTGTPARIKLNSSYNDLIAYIDDVRHYSGDISW